MKIDKANLASVPVKAPDGHVAGELFFSPSDAGIPARYQPCQKRLLAALKPLEKCNIRSDGRGRDALSAATIARVERLCYTLIDHTLGVETAKEAFREYRPFAEVFDGGFWVTQVFEAMQQIPSMILENLQQKYSQKGRVIIDG